jgi:hypothetical protein
LRRAAGAGAPALPPGSPQGTEDLGTPSASTPPHPHLPHPPQHHPAALYQGTEDEMRKPRSRGGTGLGLSICSKQVRGCGSGCGRAFQAYAFDGGVRPPGWGPRHLLQVQADAWVWERVWEGRFSYLVVVSQGHAHRPPDMTGSAQPEQPPHPPRPRGRTRCHRPPPCPCVPAQLGVRGGRIGAHSAPGCQPGCWGACLLARALRVPGRTFETLSNPRNPVQPTQPCQTNPTNPT